MPTNRTPQDILQSVFGFEQFISLQSVVIEHVLKRRDTLAIMPTGGGKSLCYQIPALLFDGLTVVVSPLIALMKDQVDQLEALGFPALFLNSSLDFEEYQENLFRVRSGEIKLLYVSPETLLTPRLLNLLSEVRLDCLTIDEAHCISEWGHDFRPEYRQLAAVRQRFPQAVCIALTATATPRVRADIKTILNFQEDSEFVASFNRPNLQIEVTARNDPGQQVLDVLHRYPGQAGIVYCFSRKQVDDLTAFLVKKGIAARPYHAGLDDAARKTNQELFLRDDVQVMVATIAFGMGINKPNVRFVIHYDLPKSIEGYYQEIGRAGRDGLPALCLLLYNYGDVRKLQYFVEQKDETERQVAYQHLQEMTRYAESASCRRVPLLAYFGEKYTTDNCEMCDNCLRSADRLVDITIPAQKFLSCVMRTGERFGPAYVAQVLLGEENEKVRQHNHNTLSTFGIGKELTQKQWQHLAQQLIQKGLLVQSMDMYRTLKVSSQGQAALKNRATIMGVLQPEEKAALAAKKKDGVEYDTELFELLRKKRKELADAAQVPPYVIFSDRTLVDMAAYFPQSLKSMLDMHGIGQVKLVHYGEIFLAVVQSYCAAKKIGEKPKETKRQAAPAAQMTLNPRHLQVAEAYNLGRTIDELMDEYQVKEGTILDHLARYAQDGGTLRTGQDFLDRLNLPQELVERALEVFAVQGASQLKPVFDALNGQVSYDDLKLIRLHYLSRAKNP